MLKSRYELVAGVVNTTFDLLAVIFVIVLLINKSHHRLIGPHVNLDYFLAYILLFGFFSILLRLVSREH